MECVKGTIRKAFQASSEPEKLLADLREFLHLEFSGHKQPIDLVRWIPIDKVAPNDYNPNKVAEVEMQLLYKSVLFDGYTQPVVTIHDPEEDKYVIVDGFHRYYIAKSFKDIRERNKGLLPCVVINKDINDRMASTIRHNRARGEHSVSGMSNMVFQMLENGWSDTEICSQLGMSSEEILKLKHITGFSKLFNDTQYSKAWQNKAMIRAKLQYEKEQRESNEE